MEGKVANLPQNEFMNGYKREKGRSQAQAQPHICSVLTYIVRHVSALAKSLHHTL